MVIFFLSQLIDESYEFLHRNLCASVLQVKLFRMPFCRDNDFDMKEINFMQDSINYCREVIGCFLATPE